LAVLVTTSAIARQGYEEVTEDRHPIIFIAGKAISDILIQKARGKCYPRISTSRTRIE
jgi:hypothetical protein